MIRSNDIVTLFSNAQERTFPENTSYRFTNRLPHIWKIPEAEKWRVGVSEFSTLDTLDTIPIDLKLNVRIAGNHIQARAKDRHHFFKVGLLTKNPVELTDSQFRDRVEVMQRYCYPIAPEYDDCKTPWNHFVNGLDGVTHQMMNESCYNTYLLFVKDGDETKLAVKENNTLISSHRFVLGPGLQQLLMLENPTGVQSLTSFENLKNRFVLSKSGEHCDFWYRILPSDAECSASIFTGFSKSASLDPFAVLKSLAERYDFFEFEEAVDGENTVVKLKFTEKRDITMIEFPDDFLHLKDSNITFQLDMSYDRYEIVDKMKKPINDPYPLGRHVKNGKVSKFFMTDGTEIRLSRKTSSSKAPVGYNLTEMTLWLYYIPKTPVMQVPYNVDFVIPKGTYTMDTFISTLNESFREQNVFDFSLTRQDDKQKKRAKLDGGSSDDRYRFKITPKIYGYEFTFDPQLQSILAIDKAQFGSTIDAVKSSRNVLLSSFTYNLMLYCNFIKPSIQGGQYEKVLRTIPFPTNNKKGENFMVEFKHIQFHDIAMSNLQDLSIEIRDDTGEVVPFKEGRTTIKLVFVKE